MKTKDVLHTKTGKPLVKRAKWCDSFASKLRGFTFRRQLQPTDGLVLVEKSDSKLTSSIHMLFVFFDLGVIWVNEAGQIVDQVVAKPWRLSYVPAAPARYVIETHPTVLQQTKIGDHVTFRD